MSDEHLHFEPSPASNIAGFGVQRPRKAVMLRFAVPLLGAIVLLVLGWWIIRLPFAIPERTALLFVISPSKTRSLPVRFRNSLPSSWHDALASSSRWPVVLGAWIQEGRWFTFAILPRWRIGSGDPNHQNSGLYGLMSDNEISSKRRLFRLTDLLSLRDGLFSDARMWINPHFIINSQENGMAEWELEPFMANMRGPLIQTDIPMVAERGVQRLTSADISANIFSETDETGFLRGLLNEIHIGDLTLNQLPILPTQINLFLGQNQSVSTTQLLFGTPLTQRQAALILSGFGISEQRHVQLPDGSLMLTNGPIHSTGTALFANRVTQRFGAILLHEREVRFGDTLTNPPNPTDSSCLLDNEWLALSEKGTSTMAKALGWSVDSSSLPSIVVGSLKNKLSICLSTTL